MIQPGLDASTVYKQAEQKWGLNNQMIVACEEMAELTVELTKLVNGKRDLSLNYDRKKLIDELADVQIMHEQMVLAFGLADEVSDRRREKLQKLHERIQYGPGGKQ